MQCGRLRKECIDEEDNNVVIGVCIAVVRNEE
jgi:hypothetical protein